jgi:membrane-associated phospholipid phosphatase
VKLLLSTRGCLLCLFLFFGIIAGVGPAGTALASDPPTVGQSPSVNSADALPDAPGSANSVTELSLPLEILKDQIPIWTSPVRIRTHDLRWLLPLGAATGVALATDTDVMRDVSRERSFNKDNVNAANVLLGGEIAIPVGLYGFGLLNGNAHGRETGILSAEALADSVVLEQVGKIIFRRERPLYNDAAGDFFAPHVGANGSFPSSHSMLAWTLAGVVTAEYPSKWVQVGMCTIASGVSLTRVLGQEHFPSDVLIGAVTGWMIGHYVFEKHQVKHISKSKR